MHFDPGLSHEEVARRYPVAMKTTSIRLDAREVRDVRLARGAQDSVARSGDSLSMRYQSWDLKAARNAEEPGRGGGGRPE